MSKSTEERASHAFEEHTGELRIKIHAPSLPELFAEAGRALAEVMEDGPKPAAGTHETIELQARDRDALLVHWLNELIFRAETSRKIFTELDVRRVNGGELVATIRGHDAPSARPLVKAATFHDLRIVESPDGFSVAVVLDV